ncbi:hypothetical protein PR202_ga04294 [Eleusine coracana subsp. coracana]|uniref:RING-type domain-containing protein n=1 Tax=Eleusine coracana subsp. coracana TaxID=191504 RepID=A0AAV5BSQ4_ELECO|nr:hypothetical protein PR202_ga04294 [Eleusine coracana subsp. coracana]
MDPPAGGSADRRGAGPGAGAAPSGLRRYGLNFSASSLLQAPLAALLEYSGVVPSGPAPQPVHPSAASSSPSSSSSEVDGLLSAAAAGDGRAGSLPEDSIEATAGSEVDQASSVAGRGGSGADTEANGGSGGGAGAAGSGAGDRAYQRYDVHHVARWIEQILPFSLLLLVVFIRQHLQGFFVTIWIAAVMFKSNDILRKQTALKGERKISLLVGITGQMLTLVEYLLLLYRALLPTPVWYRFFLNKEYGSLFSSLTTGLYLTFKLTSVVEKVQSFLAAVKALSRKDVHYGSYATAEQVIAAGDMCAICQEKMHVPVLLRCKHIFCEDCVSEWSINVYTPGCFITNQLPQPQPLPESAFIMSNRPAARPQPITTATKDGMSKAQKRKAAQKTSTTVSKRSAGTRAKKNEALAPAANNA